MPNGIAHYDIQTLPKLLGTYVKIKDEQGIIIPSGADYLLFEITNGDHGSRFYV